MAISVIFSLRKSYCQLLSIIRLLANFVLVDVWDRLKAIGMQELCQLTHRSQRACLGLLCNVIT